MTTIGFVHPGEPGASAIMAARAGGGRVLAVSAGRGTDTRRRAAAPAPARHIETVVRTEAGSCA